MDGPVGDGFSVPGAGTSGAADSAQLPAEAPPLLWLVALLCVAHWWLHPWLDKLFAARAAAAAANATQRAAIQQQEKTVADGVPSAPLAEDAIAPAKTAAPRIDEEQYEPTPRARTADVLGIDVEGDFERAFAEAAEVIEKALQVPPKGPEYVAANTALQRAAEVLDRIFKNTACPEEMSRVSRLKEGTTAFSSAFGEHRAGLAARSLLVLAGFDRDASENAIWTFPCKDARARFRAMAVRLCLQKLSDLQRRRGSQVWAQASNADVVPKPGDATLPELFVLYKGVIEAVSPPQSSFRERNTEVATRVKLHARRHDKGLDKSLVLLDGLVNVARILADGQRNRARQLGGRPPAPSDAEVDEILAKLPLPPGFDVVTLYHATDELPHVFGLASTTGKGGNEGDTDKAAEIIANEVVASWDSRSPLELRWPCAIVYGVGACLDYTMNRGFVVAFLVGFDGISPTEELAAAEQERKALRQRKMELPKPQAPYGARVHSMKSWSEPEAGRRRGGG